MGNFEEFLRAHRYTILFMFGGLTFAVLLITIGFWRTLLLTAILGICFLLGYLMDKNGLSGVKGFFERLFARDRHE